MLRASIDQIESTLTASATVLDVGGWASPLARADWVIDLMPYETRGMYGSTEGESERFSAETWVVRDICDHEPWPFANRQFDYAICSHTLEDIRDPIWVCSELVRTAAAGYIEMPSRLEEQSVEVHGPWVGWSHHRWLADVNGREIQFVHKPHMLAGRQELTFPSEFGAALTPEQRVQTLFWEGRFEYRERIFIDFREFDEYLASFVRENLELVPSAGGPRARLRRLMSR